MPLAVSMVRILNCAAAISAVKKAEAVTRFALSTPCTLAKLLVQSIGDEQIEFPLGCLDLGDVNAEEVDRIELKPILCFRVPRNRASPDPMPLQTAVNGERVRRGDCRPKRVKAVVERRQLRCLKATTTGSLGRSADRPPSPASSTWRRLSD